MFYPSRIGRFDCCLRFLEVGPMSARVLHIWSASIPHVGNPTALRLSHGTGYRPSRQEVMIQSCSNASPLNGCSSIFLDCGPMSACELHHSYLDPHTMTGGSCAVRALGSTAWLRNSDSSTMSSLKLPVRLESDLTRLTMLVLSVRCRSNDTDWAETLPLGLAVA
jgi:hypothetical protein